jgi:site-specific recombinase XerC
MGPGTLSFPESGVPRQRNGVARSRPRCADGNRNDAHLPAFQIGSEANRLLAVADSLKARVMLSLSYGCGLSAGEVVRLKVKHIDSAQKIIRIEQSKGRKDRRCSICCGNGGRCVPRVTTWGPRNRNVGYFLAARGAEPANR